MGNCFHRRRPDRGAGQGSGLAREISYPLGIAWGLLNHAYNDYFVARYDVAMSQALESLDIFEELEEPAGHR